MDVVIIRLTPDTHRLRVERSDGTVDEITLNSRSFLNHSAPRVLRPGAALSVGWCCRAWWRTSSPCTTTGPAET